MSREEEVRPKFATVAEAQAYERGQRDGAEAAVDTIAELVEECERRGITDIARLVRGMNPRLDREN